MKAVALTRYLPIDDPQSLFDTELPDPRPLPRDLLVEVRAIAVNPVDTKVRRPKDTVEPQPRVLGWDVAGVVREVGSAVTLFKPGDEVYYAGSIIRPGGNSQLHCVDERIVALKPRSLDFAQAAALPLTTITAWEALFHRLGVSRDGAHKGKTLLIIGAAGGVGSIAIQLAKKLAGLTVIATTSRPESTAWVRALGADASIDHTQPLGEQLKALGHAEVDYIFNASNTDPYFPAFGALIKPQGKIVLIVEAKAPLDMEQFKAKSASVHWEMMFTRAMFETADMIEQHKLLTEAAALIDAGTLRTTLGEHYGLIDAANLRRAHAALENGRTLGKIVMEGF
jgi:NADPH:quinone reductase